MECLFGEAQISRNTAVTIGKFDGLHLGHIRLLEELQKTAEAQGLATLILSFAPHPAEFFSGKVVPLILSRAEKLYLLEQMGIDFYVEYPFSAEFARQSPQNFIENIIYKQFCCNALVVGENFRYGANGVGDVAFAQKLGNKLGFETYSVAHAKDDMGKISSATIRKYIASGDLSKAKALMGRNYFIMGQVCHGAKIGREIGFPTANMALDSSKILIPSGVYATKTYVEGIAYDSVTNIGTRPTVDGKEINAETHLLSFCGDLYGKTVRVDFLTHIRDESKFSSLESLKNQLARDIDERLLI